MKDEKPKPRGMKHKIREEKTRQERIGFAIVVAGLIIAVSITGFLISPMFNQPSADQSSTSLQLPFKAGIVDHLSLTVPNQAFVETATNILEQAGYRVDYYSGEEVTVEFYGNLPTHNYGLLILRVHSAVPHHQSEHPTRLALFSSEPYSTTKYVYEQLAGQVGRVVYSEGGSEYFGIGPEFVTQTMKGAFKNTTVIMMGCEGLKYTMMAEAFAQKGAKAYISWSDSVLASHTDQSTICLLEYLIAERHVIKEAVEKAMKEVGPDPFDGSVLLYYPLEAGDLSLQVSIGNLISDSIHITVQNMLKGVKQKDGWAQNARASLSLFVFTLYTLGKVFL